MTPPSSSSKAVFYLKGKDAQQQGIRLILTSKLIERHFQHASVWDDPNGIQTEVLLEGDKAEILKFHEETKEHLIDWINERNRDLGIATRISRNPGVEIEFTEPDFNEDLRIHDLGLFGHSLTFDEVSKGYNVFLDNIKTNKELKDTFVDNIRTNEELRETLVKLSDVIDKKL